MKKLILVSLIFITCLSSCQKEKVCGVTNPKKDLPWLKERISGFKKDQLNINSKVYQCAYRDGTGFLIEYCVGCPDAGYILTNCEGENLCVMWGVSGDPCEEYCVDFENKELIWKRY
jgi:hypothetical protein